MQETLGSQPAKNARPLTHLDLLVDLAHSAFTVEKVGSQLEKEIRRLDSSDRSDIIFDRIAKWFFLASSVAVPISTAVVFQSINESLQLKHASPEYLTVIMLTAMYVLLALKSAYSLDQAIVTKQELIEVRRAKVAEVFQGKAELLPQDQS